MAARRKNRNKLKSMKYHSRSRALSRYGLAIGNEEERQIIYDIQNGLSEYILKQSVNRSIHRVRVGAGMAWCYVVYDRKRSALATFLTSAQVNELIGVGDV